MAWYLDSPKGVLPKGFAEARRADERLRFAAVVVKLQQVRKGSKS